MAKKKDESQVEAKAEAEVSPELLKKLEAEAFARVCKAAGTTPQDIEQIESARVQATQEVEYDTNGIFVSINGHEYPAKGRATRAEAEQIVALASAKRQRLISEKIGRDMQVIQMVSGGVSYKEIKRQDEAGIEVSKQ